MTLPGRGAPAGPRPLPPWVVIAMTTLIGLNLRASMGSVPPLLDEIATELDLNNTTSGLLTSVVIVFIGICAPLGQRLASRIGSERATAVVLGVLSAGGLLRLLADDLGVFLLSSAVSGAGMGGCTVLMPSLIAHHVPRVRGFATGLYSTGLASGVALGAAIAVPSEALLGGWRPALAVWGVVTGLTAVLWTALLPRLRAVRGHDVSSGRDEADAPTPAPALADHRLPWRNRVAWGVTGFTTASMVIGFSGLAWVTPFYVEQGVSAQRAAGYFVLFQLVQIAAMLTLPWLTDFTRDRRPLLAFVLGCSVAGVTMLVVAPTTLAVPAVSLFGLGAGGGSTLGLILLVDVTGNQADGARLNAMVMLIAYPAGALAPLLLGLLRDLTGGFGTGYLVILGITLLTLARVVAFRPGLTLESGPARPEHPGGEDTGRTAVVGDAVVVEDEAPSSSQPLL